MGKLIGRSVIVRAAPRIARYYISIGRNAGPVRRSRTDTDLNIVYVISTEPNTVNWQRSSRSVRWTALRGGFRKTQSRIRQKPSVNSTRDKWLNVWIDGFSDPKPEHEAAVQRDRECAVWVNEAQWTCKPSALVNSASTPTLTIQLPATAPRGHVDRLKCSLPTCPPGSTTTTHCECWIPHETTRGPPARLQTISSPNFLLFHPEHHRYTNGKQTDTYRS